MRYGERSRGRVMAAWAVLLAATVTACGNNDPPKLIDTRDASTVDVPDGSVVLDDGAVVPADVFTLPQYEVVRFDAQRSEFPEGVVTRGGNAYVSFRTLPRVVEVTPTGSYRAYATVPSSGSVRGMAFDAMGRLWLSVVSSGAAQAGVYRAPAGGGEATLVVRDDGLPTPAGLAVDATGAVWVAQSDPGAVWRIAPDGTLARWTNDAMLTGGGVICGPTGTDRTGANGLVVRDDAVYVSHTDRSTVIRVARNADGSAGAVSTLTMRDCAKLATAWGVSVGPMGSLLVAASGANAIARVATDGTTTVLSAPMGLLRSPTGVAWDESANVVWVANSANAEAVRAGGVPLPSVARVPVM